MGGERFGTRTNRNTMEPAVTLGTGFFQYTPRILYHEEQRVHPVHMEHHGAPGTPGTPWYA